MKKIKLLAVSSALFLSASMLTAVPATAQTSLNVSSSSQATASSFKISNAQPLKLTKSSLKSVRLSSTYPFNNKKTADFYTKNLSNLNYFYIPYSSGASTSLRPQVQIYNTKTKRWSTVTTARTAKNSNKTNLRFSYRLSSVKDLGKKSLRIYIPATSKTKSFASATSVLNFKKESYSLGKFLNSTKSSIAYKSNTEYTVYAPKTVGTLNLQKYNGKTKRWAQEKRASFKKNSGNSRQYKFKIYHEGKAGTSLYRLQSNSTKTHNQYVTKNLSVTFGKGKATINDSKPVDNTNLSTRTRDKAGFNVTNAPNTTVYMQYYSTKSKKWYNSTSVKTKNTTSRQKVMLPYPKYKPGTYKIRVYVKASANFNSTSSATRTVKYVDQNKYKGVQKTAYNHMKKWCPGVTVGTTNFRGNVIGTAHLPLHSISVHPNLKGNNLKYTSIHECAHILQLQAFNEDMKNLRDRAKVVYGKGNSRGSGMEIQADCIAQSLGGSSVTKYSYYMYGKKCNSKQLAAAKKVVQGKRY